MKLTRKEKNKRLALHFGWEFCEKAPVRKGKPLPWLIEYCRHEQHTSGIWRNGGRLINYYHDFEAMYRRWEALSEPEKTTFAGHIRRYHEGVDVRIFKAFKEYGAEALGLTLGLWIEDESNNQDHGAPCTVTTPKQD